MLTVASVVHTEADPNLVDEDFLSTSRRDYMKMIRSLTLRSGSCKGLFVEVIVPLFVGMGYLRVCTWFGIVDSLAV